MHYVYILYSARLDQFYRGQTRDLEDRMNRHNSGQESATRGGVPWELLWYAEKPNRSEAVLLESKLKNLSRARLIRLMTKYDDNYVGRDLHPEE